MSAEPAVTANDRRNARLYLSGLTVSLLGNGAMSLVAGVWTKALTGSSAQAGLVSACLYLPSLCGPVAGLIVDRVDRRRWLMAVNAVAAAAMLPLLAVHSADDVWLIYLAMAIYGLVLVLADPAEDALFAEMLPLPLRRAVNGRRLAIQESGRLLAPLLGAGLFTLAGGGAVAGLDAATFVVAAAATARLSLPRQAHRPAGPTAGWWRELTAGARQIGSEPELRRVVAVAAAVMAISGVGVAAQYSLVAALHRPPAFLGVLSAALGGGSVVAALTAGRIVTRVGERALAVAGLIAFALGTGLRTQATLVPAILGSLTLGFALPWVLLAVLNLAQRLTPGHLQGRVSAAVALVLFGPQAPAQALGAGLIARTGFAPLYLASALLALMLAGWLARSPARRPSAGRADAPAGRR